MSDTNGHGEAPVKSKATAALELARETGDRDEIVEGLPGGLDDTKRAETGPKGEKDPDGFLGWRRTLRDATSYGELRRTPYGLRPITTLLWVAIFFNLNSEILGVALRDVLRDIDMNSNTYFRYNGFVGTCLIVAGLWVAFKADRVNRVRMVAIALFIGSFFAALTAAGRSTLTFGAPDVASTVAFFVAFFPVASLFADYYPPEVRGKVFALWGLFGAMTATVIPAAAGEITDRLGWRFVYLATAVPVALVAFMVVIRLREPVRGYMERKALGANEDDARVEEETPSFGESWRTVLGIRTLRRLVVASAIRYFGRGVIFSATITYFFTEKGLTIRSVGYVTAAFGLFVLPGSLIAGGVVDRLIRIRPAKVLTFLGVLSLVGTIPLVAYALNAPIWVIVVVGGLIAFVDAITGPAASVLIVQITPANIRNTGEAVRSLTGLFRNLVGLSVGGIIVAEWGFQTAFWVAIPIYAIAAIIEITSAPLFELDMRSAFAANLAASEWKKAKEENQGKLLVCRDVDVVYPGGVQVLFGIDFDVEEGQVIALLGTNGAGKSTLLRAISGTTQASSGAIVFDGRDITYMPPHESAARGIAFMPGGRGVFPELSVRENLALGTWMIEDEDEIRSLLNEVFEIFPVLAERAEIPAGNLSGGEQQQLSLALAFLERPRLLMIDELSLGLSPAVVGQLIDIVKELNRRGITIIVVEQSVNVALTIAEKAIFMEKGEVKFFGDTAELLRRPDILRAVYVKGTGALTEGPASTRRSDRERRYLELQGARPVLEVQGLTKIYGGVTALDSLDLALKEGEVLGIIGPNGSGKTTLFELISGFQIADAGSVVYEGVDITNMSPEDRAKRRLIRRFQDAKLFPSLTVYETLLVALEQRLEVKSVFANALSLPQSRRSEKRVRERAERLIEILDLGSYRDKFVKELSTGLRRIVDLACVLANDPKVLLLDEPSSGIAQAEAEGLGPLLKRVRFETGCSILIIEHDMPLISSVSDEMVALDRGQFVLRGTPDEVLNDERVIEAYLGGKEAAMKRSGSLN